MINSYDKSRKWVYYLTRPCTLFETSLWQAWYESKYFEEFFGKKATDVLCIEEVRHQVRQYRTREQLFHLGCKLFLILLFQRRRILELMEEATAVNQQAVKILQKGPSFFSTLEESVAFLVKLAFCGTLLPNLPVLLSLRKKLPKGKLGERIVELRSASYYPRFTKEIVVPLAAERLYDLGVTRSDELIDFVTVKELLLGSIRSIVSREQSFLDGNYFVYQQIKDTESIQWTHNPLDIIFELQPKLVFLYSDQIRGQTAFAGVVRGAVKIVIDYDSAKNEFREGEILVAASTNPTLLPLLKKAAAIVTDEGGITSHAAIVARELRKPCIIGTKIATKILKNGDVVEVDAHRGVVRILKRGR